MSEITKDQIKRIHILKAAIGMPDDEYRDILGLRYQVYSSKELGTLAAAALIAELEQRAVKSGKWRRRPISAPEKKKKYDHLLGRDPFLASPAQLRKIEAMWATVSRQPDDESKDRALGRFIKRIVGCEHITWIDRRDAHKIIKALDMMKSANNPIPLQHQGGTV